MVKKKLEEYVATGRRKTAVSSVRLRPNGSGKVEINCREFEKYFPFPIHRETILAPLRMIGREKEFDLVIRTRGGGTEGQMIATRHGLARALVLMDENLRSELKSKGYLTRDSRKKERKKYGLKKARKSFQFSKR